MVKKAAIKKKGALIRILPLVIFCVVLILVVAAILRVGVGDAEWAGLIVSDLDGELRARYEVPKGESGVCIVDVQEQALNSGVKVGDLLKSINGKRVTSVASFLKVARYVDIRDGALLDILRTGEPLYITLYDRPGIHGKIKRYLGWEAQNMAPVAFQTTPQTTALPAGPPVTEAAWLGMELELGPNGIILDDVPLGSSAEKAGLKTGDIIKVIDGSKITSIADLNKATMNGKITTAALEVVRGVDTVYVFIDGNPAKGVGVRAAFNLNKPLMSNVFNARPAEPVIANAPGPAASLPPVEGHWAGMETLTLSPQLALFMNIPEDIRGVLIDEVTMEVQDAGILAADVVCKIGNMNTFSLKQFRAATRTVKNQTSVDVYIYRKGNYRTYTVRSIWPLGVAQMETAPMIPKGAVAPHRYRGACTDCHTIGNNGIMAKDGGDLLNLNAPPIRRGAKAPHRYRGNCATCHIIQK